MRFDDQRYAPFCQFFCSIAETADVNEQPLPNGER